MLQQQQIQSGPHDPTESEIWKYRSTQKPDIGCPPEQSQPARAGQLTKTRKPTDIYEPGEKIHNIHSIQNNIAKWVF